jgi:hypothetical protein
MSAPSKSAVSRAVSGAVSGAIAGGLPLGSFRVRVDLERGIVDLWPVNGNEAESEANDLDAEIRAFLNGKG